MTHFTTKIALIFSLGLFVFSCSTFKEKNDKILLSKNKVVIDDIPSKKTEILELPLQKPNTTILGYRARLGVYSLARKNPDSSYQQWLQRNPTTERYLHAILSQKQTNRLGKSFAVSGVNTFLKEIGEPPQYLNTSKIASTNKRFKNYFANQGYFNAKVTSETLIKDKNNTAEVVYRIHSGNRYYIDSIQTSIESPALQGLYNESKIDSKIKKNNPYQTQSLEEERERITTFFRDKGVYHFQTNNITYKVDTLNTGHKANISVYIKDRYINSGDTIVSKPFNVFKVARVNVFIEDPMDRKSTTITDTAYYNGVHFYSYGKFNYRPKAITDAIFINKDSLYSDNQRIQTGRSISNLKIFQFPNIQYIENKQDTLNKTLTANIYLVPKDKYSISLAPSIIHSNIQDVGAVFTSSIGVRNLFNGAEVLQISGRGNVGVSKALSSNNDEFVNLSEYGIDFKLNVPRFLAPFGTRKWIPKQMLPSTLFSFGFFKQHNIGLDKQNLIGTIGYNWEPKKQITTKLDLLNIQFIRNVNTSNYFNVYRTSYNRLNEIADEFNTDPNLLNSSGKLDVISGTRSFISNVLDGNTNITPSDPVYVEIRRINERKIRLSENNLIVASNFQFAKTTKKDELDFGFWLLKTKIESAGFLMSLVSNLDSKNKDLNTKRTFYDVEYSQYGKVDLEFIKHWDLSRKRVLAFRYFTGVAIPYGNSTNIPFSRSYFAGGSNDNRAWQPYQLGPGSSRNVNDFNEANFKLAFNLEYRFVIYNQLNGAFFVDAGNIWNVKDDTTDPDYTFQNLNSLNEIAIGSGFGLRYDFSFFVFRIDMGFKNYNPANELRSRWTNEYNFDSSVVNIGINYPF